ncbi:MAG: glycosyltransferase family 4 protein [Anaerolineae bacterium]|nr:glycosyltransferase family 4 protein [Anaerolineae bacterium]
MRLLLVSSEFPPGPGGIGRHAFHIARGLKTLGWNVMTTSPQDYATDQEIAFFENTVEFPIVRQHHSSNFLMEATHRFRLLSRLVKHYQPDVVIATGSRPVWLVAALTRFTSIPWLAVAHGGMEFGTPNAWEQVITRWAYSQPDAVVCVSQYTMGQMNQLGVKPKHQEVIHNGADAIMFYPLNDQVKISHFRQKLFEQEDVHMLLTVGSVTERKGQEVVISSLPAVVKEFPNVHYVMVGRPVLQEKLTALAQKLGVERHIHFLGHIDDATLLTVYNASEVFLMTSCHSRDGDSEGFGIAAIEAALCGKPSVVSNGSGLAEAVIHEQTGLHVSENDAEETAQAILCFLRNADFREKIGMQARDRALRDQTWQSCSKAYGQVLERIVQERAS